MALRAAASRVPGQSRLAVLLAVVIPLGGCERPGDSHRQVLEDRIAATEQMVEALAAVRDEPSARDAAPRIEQLGDELEAIRRRQLVLPPPSVFKQSELDAEYGERLRRAETAMTSEARRVLTDTRIGRHIAPALRVGPELPEP